MSGQEGDSGGSVEAGPTPAQDLYREKPASTVVRILTVFAYLSSVSFAAILLSVYYICVWKSPEVPKSDNDLLYSRRAGEPHEYDPGFIRATTLYPDLGGSNTPVNQTATPPMLDDYTNVTNSNDTTAEGIFDIENSTLTALDNETSTEEPFKSTTVT